LCAKNRALRKNSTNSIPKMRVLNSQLMLDEMWHTFIVFTIDYHEFCNDFLGGYIHHAPTTRNDKEKQKNETREEQEEYLKKLYGFVYDILGEETLLKWYETLAGQYPADKINSLRK